MPLVYADTSVLFAYLHPRDEFADVVAQAVAKESPDFFYWALIKLELRHNLRQANTDKHGAAAWRALRAAEAARSRLRWQTLDLDRVFEDADLLSGQHANKVSAGAADFVHLAAASKISFLTGMDAFWTCDTGQFEAAKMMGLPARLFSI